MFFSTFVFAVAGGSDCSVRNPAYSGVYVWFSVWIGFSF